MPLSCDGPDPAFVHFNYDDLNGNPAVPRCDCFLCNAWWEQLAIVQRIEGEGQSEGHLPSCMCPYCRVLRTARINMTAAGVRRDAYSELSYIARDRKWRDEFLTWFLSYLKTSRRKASWFAFKMDRKTLGAWVEDWATQTGRI